MIDKDNVIVAGHTRYKASKKLKLETVPCIVADDLTDEQIKAFRLADNKVNEKAEWDFDLLDAELNDILNIDMDALGFDFDLIEEEPKPVEREDLSDKVGETFQVIVECENELQQEQVYYKLTQEGLECRVLTL